MRVSVVCESVLLSRSLKMFLKPYLQNYKKSDFVITDKRLDIDKPQFIISHDSSADLIVPFGNSTLLVALEKFYNKISQDIDTTNLEDKIEKLLKEYTSKMMTLIKEHS